MIESQSKGPSVNTWALMVLLILALAGCTTLSERSGDSLEANAYGVWSGRIPCASCPGVDVRLVLWRNPDFFRLTETYLDAAGGPKTFTAFGTWDLEKIGETPELGRFKLVTDDARRTLYLERMPSGNLRLLDADGEPQSPALNYILERTRARTEG